LWQTTVHPRIAHEDAPAQPPAPQVLLDLLDRGHIGRLAGEHPRSHRKPVACDGESNDDLGCIVAPVLGVPSLAKRLVDALELVALDLILRVHLEVQRCRVVEDHVYVRVHQVGRREVHRLLDLRLVLLQEVHREVQVVQLQRPGARQEHLLA